MSEDSEPSVLVPPDASDYLLTLGLYEQPRLGVLVVRLQFDDRHMLRPEWMSENNAKIGSRFSRPELSLHCGLHRVAANHREDTAILAPSQNDKLLENARTFAAKLSKRAIDTDSTATSDKTCGRTFAPAGWQ